MKTIKITSALLVIILLFSSCSKEPGFGGKADLKGNVSLNGASVAGAIVHLAFNAKEATTTFDATTVTDGSGNYKFSGLNKGDYFVTAEYTTPAMIKFKSGGSLIKIGDKKAEVSADLTLQ